jgi:oligopeptidase A
MENNNSVNNPLLITDGLPRYDLIQPEHVVPAIRQVLKESEASLSELEKTLRPSWKGLLKPLEELGTLFEYSWGPVGHLLAVRNNEELRTAHQTVLNEVVTFSLRLRQSQAIYKGLKAIMQDAQWERLSPAKQRVIELKVKSAEHAGIGLEGEKKKRFLEIENELSQLSTDFSNNVLDATKAFSLDITDQTDTQGWPGSLKQIAAQSYKLSHPESKDDMDPEHGPWRITLDFPSFMPFMQHSHNREMRKKVYHAQITRAASGEKDNSALIIKILNLRDEKAKLLGFDNYAQLSLDAKMASDVPAVEKMFDELKTAAEPFSKKEFQEVKDLAMNSGQTEALRQWDWSFWSERLREKQFDYTDDQLRPYFQLPMVLNGLFSLAGNLFDVFIEMETEAFPAWHPDVRLFRVKNMTGDLLASFYLDPFSRPQEKRGGAWMNECLNRMLVNGKTRLPVIHICLNSTPPIGETPSLMSFREVETLFHEFGHALQGMLTTVDETEVAGVNGVEWDAVELPSQFMENWCYHKPTLIGMTQHVETGAQLPDELFEKIKASKTFQSGYMTMRQLLFGTIDMRLHSAYKVEGGESPFELYDKLASELSVFTPYEHDRFLCSFSHIFAGGYAAGYYSYKWAEVLSSDAFSAFEEGGLDSLETVREVGLQFRDTVLAQGGSRHPMEVFKSFRGREPSTKALMRHCGFNGEN